MNQLNFNQKTIVDYLLKQEQTLVAQKVTEYFHKYPERNNLTQFRCPQRKHDDILKYDKHNVLHKNCSKCFEWYPATTEYWHKDKKGIGGYDGLCKQCKSERRKKHYEQLKKENRHLDHYKNNKWQYIAHGMKKRGYPKITEQDIEDIVQSSYNKHKNTYCCSYCDRPMNEDMIHIDHVIPYSEFDHNYSYPILNLQSVCKYCNRSKSADNILEWYQNQLFFKKEKYQELLNLVNRIHNGVKPKQQVV